ncbi:molybdenum cofactor guanylyltransferase MobA [Paracoccus jeotgali]|uniref:molybdenum cofactor guanylyltransferase MobA n=1 Tax=Paracoccus jeotgali TaxID=2065379 RepID=UPI0028AC49B3|nr:molybdenum cofactor guanylyltransferase MobA [Paracoccus jeotgali]
MQPVPAVILAGGLARRMGGGDKVLLPLAGRPLLAHLLDRLHPQTGPIALNANGDAARFADFKLPVLPDPDFPPEVPPRPGPLAGILAAILWAKAQDADRVLVVAGDTPFLPADLLSRLQDAAGAAGLAMAADHAPDGLRLHPTTALWPTRLAAPLRAAIIAGQRRVRAFAAEHDAATAVFPALHAADGAELSPFFNINTPEDLAQATAWLDAENAVRTACPTTA